MLEQIDFDIIDDIVRVCRQPGRERRPDRLTRKSYHTRGGRFSCADINERGSYSWFCAAAMLAMCGVDLRADPPAAVWQDLLNNRVEGVRSRVYDDWLEATRVRLPPAGTASPPPRVPVPMSPRVMRLAIGRAKPRAPRVRNPYVVATQIIEIVTDIRRVAAAINAPTIGAVQWSDYRVGGGRFTREQINAVSNWPAVRAAADLAKGLDSQAA